MLVSLLPLEHSLCVHEPVEHDWPQIELTSPTQIESHAVVQQYESCAQISPAQVLQLPSRFEPVEQIGCAQLPVPPVQVPDVLQVWPLPQVPHEPPQPSSPQVLPAQFGVQPWVWHWPAEVQVWPLGQVPQVPPQPSLPHCLPLQFGVQEVTVRVAAWLVTEADALSLMTTL